MRLTTRRMTTSIAAFVAAIGLGAAATAAAQTPTAPLGIRIVPSGTAAVPLPIPVRLKVVSFNIGSGNDWKDADMPYDAIARHILDQAPDVVLLQEVHDRYIDTRGPRTNQPEYWRQRLGMYGAYLITYKAYDFWGNPLGTAGDMVLSRYPIVRVDQDRQPFDQGIDFWPRFIFMGAKKSPRSKMSAVIDVRGTRVRIASVHLPGNEPARTLEYLDWLDRFPEPTIVGGDFNRGWQDLLDGADGYMKTIFARYDVVPNRSTLAERTCDGSIDWVLVRRGQSRFRDAGGYGKVSGQCPVTSHYDPFYSLSDHPLVYGSVEIEEVPVFNPGFENGFQAWSVWSPDPAYRAAILPGGDTGLSSAVQYNAAGFIFRDLAAKPGREYEISARVRCAFGTAQGKLSVHDTAGNLYQETGYACNPNTWTTLRLRYNTNATTKLRVHFYRSDGPGIVLWDSLMIRPAGQ